MPTLVVMTGLQGSGKSTFCRMYLSDFARINLDELHTRNKENAAIAEAIKMNRDIVIDNTNPTAEDRRKYIEIAKAAGYKPICYFMQSRVKDCIERNQMRTGKAKVPNTAIAATSNKLEMPSTDEGFEEIYYVSINDTGFAIEDWRE